MTATHVPTLPEHVLYDAADAAGVAPIVLAKAVELALAGGPDDRLRGWRELGRCRELGSRMFFPDRGEPVSEQLAVCASCPAQTPCLAVALGNNEKWGVWGGTTVNARRRLRKVLREAGIMGVRGEGAYIAWNEDGADGEPPEPAPPPRRLRPWDHQTEAARAIVDELRDGGTCQIAIATAGGKTHIGVWAARDLGVDQVLVLVPSLSLVAQTAETWRSDAHWQDARMLAVCSDTGELELEATTDPFRVLEFLDEPGQAVVFATYQSSPVLAEAGCAFELAIADEAHHLAGERDKAFAAIVRGDIPAKRTLYMTATPKRFARRKTDVDVVDMDGPEFGRRVYTLSLTDAVAAGVVADYRVIVAAVEADVLARVGQHPDLEGVDPHLLAGAIAVVRAMGEYQLDSCLSFHTRVDRARTFAQLIGPVAEALPALRPPGPGWAGFVHGDVSVRIRRRLLNRLADPSTWGVIANAKALGEGVDLPALDAVAIVDPKNAEADVLQATGRALRKPNGTNKVGTVLLPVLLTGASDAEDPLAGVDARSLEIVSGVLRALRSHDVDLGSRLDGARRGVAREFTGKPDVAAALRRASARALLRSRVELWLPGGAAGELAGAMAVHLVRESTSAWEEAFGHLERWIAEHGTARVPQGDGKVPDATGTFSLGAWCTVQRTLRRRGLLDDERERRLSALPGWRWDPREERWWEQFDALADYVRVHNGYPPQSGGRYKTLWKGEKVAQFVNESRNGYRDNGWLSKFPKRVAALEALPGWVWNTRDAEWEANFARLQRWASLVGHADPRIGDLVDGVDMGRWVSKQRSRINGTDGGQPLRADRVARLRALPGWVDHTREAGWEEGFARLAAYLTEHRDYPPQKYRESDGYHLGAWVAKQRHTRTREKMRPDRRSRLEQLPGWSWTPWEDGWQRAYDILCRHAAANPPERGVLRIPIDRVEDFDINAWCTNQRRERNTGKLAADRVELLEQVPGWSWNVADAKFERGLAAVRSWIERERNTEPPSAHREDGVSIRAWIYSVRAQRRAGQLEADRAARLEAIAGWTWEPQTTAEKGWAAQWERAYAVLVLWLDTYDGVYPRQDDVVDGVRIGSWINKQRGKHAAGTLPADRAARLEQLPGWRWRDRLDQEREAS